MDIKTINLFCYGSNSIEQIKSRIKRLDEIYYEKAVLKDHVRIFGGISKKWNNGAICSILPLKNKSVYGISIKITEDELKLLNEFEKGYKLEKKFIFLEKTNKETESYLYIKDNIEFKALPSIDYLNAIKKMLNDRNNSKDIEKKIFIRIIMKN